MNKDKDFPETAKETITTKHFEFNLLYSDMSNERAIELAKQSIAPCSGITLHALKKVIELAEAYVNEHKSS